ncbi:MAG: AAA family ATPase, partial [Polyangiales bacterium]
RRVCLFGPESTGKSSLSARLAAHFRTVAVPDHARVLLERQGGQVVRDDIERIARGQLAAEDALARSANRVLFCDTDALTTRIWSEALFGECPAWIVEESERRRYDVTLLCDVDVPWVWDEIRYLPDNRGEFFDRCERALVSTGRRFIRIHGDWDERFARALEAVAAIDPRLPMSAPVNARSTREPP